MAALHKTCRFVNQFLKFGKRNASNTLTKTNAIHKATRNSPEPLCNCDDATKLNKCSRSLKCQYRVSGTPVYIKTYGCQMNVNDTGIVANILQEYGYNVVNDDSEAEIHLLVTCAIRDSAEAKIWSKLNYLKTLKEDQFHPLKQIGLLGCMAERLKEKALQMSGSVDIIAGPDSYRDLPRLFSVNRLTNEKAINCLLSFDETYSDIRPVTKIGDVTSFVSITRGCDNLCSYCIVPFTRGKERSRPIPTIIDEVKSLYKTGIREVTLLGQNVNSYRDLSTNPESMGRHDLVDKTSEKERFADGFKTVYKPRTKGISFDILLEEVAKFSPELRVRMTSPHPKDFTNDVIDVMARYKNIGRSIHLPAQSGSDSVLEKMRRGYTAKAYLNLVDRIRTAIPEIAFTSDFITGFCGETEEDHQATIDLIQKVGYTFIYAFPYSMREKTNAYHTLTDDVSREVKVRRLREIMDLFRSQANELNGKLVGTDQLVLIESFSKRSDEQWKGRIETNTTTILPMRVVPDLNTGSERQMRPGDYVSCKITSSNSQSLQAEPIAIISQADYHDGNQQRIAQSANRR